MFAVIHCIWGNLFYSNGYLIDHLATPYPHLSITTTVSPSPSTKKKKKSWKRILISLRTFMISHNRQYSRFTYQYQGQVQVWLIQWLRDIIKIHWIFLFSFLLSSACLLLGPFSSEGSPTWSLLFHTSPPGDNLMGNMILFYFFHDLILTALFLKVGNRLRIALADNLT